MKILHPVVRRTLLLTVVALGTTAVAWSGLSYLRLVRLQVRVADACSRVEASSRSRVELVENLIHCSETFVCLDADRRTALRGVTTRIERSPFVPEIAGKSVRYRDFLAAQTELTTTLDRLWSDEPAAWDGARLLSEDLRARLDRSSALLEESIAELERSLDSYRTATTVFPDSLVAGLAGPEPGPPLRPWVVAGAAVSDPSGPPNR